MAGPGGLSALLRTVLGRAGAQLPGTPLVVALSGGADSAVCAWAAVQSGAPVRAVTVDHGLPASAGLVAAAGEVAAHLGIPHRVVLAPAPGGSEDDLRRTRYRALEESLEEGETLLTGHTSDDQAETVLGNLLRGAGAGGLGGIPRRRGVVLRPLLDVSAAETREAAAELSLPFADDPGNTATGPRRNLLRHRVLPLLEDEINPRAREALARAGGLLAADDALLAARAARVPRRIRGGEVGLAAAALATLPPPVAARAARSALRALLDPYPGRAADVAAVLAVASGGSARESLAGGIIAEREGPWVTLHRGPPPVPGPEALPVPGTVRFGDWELGAARASAVPVPVGRRTARVATGGGDLEVRGAASGDRIEIGTGSKPVVEALREAGVAARRRPGWPLVSAGGRIVWVAGVRAVPAAGGPDLVLSVREAW